MKKIMAIALAVCMVFAFTAVTAGAAGTAVAAIGSATYETLAAALNASSEGDTITLLDDVTENVTISKNITVDGDNHKYEGKITLSKTGATIKNVNFVNSQIFKAKDKKIGTITVENCSFEGQIAASQYAINIGFANGLVVENCSAKNVGFGFIYVPSEVDYVSVKNVDIDGASYGIHIVYNTETVIENVTIKNAYVGIMNQSYGAKTIKITDCKVAAEFPAVIWERKATTQTYVFEGNNEFVAPEGNTWMTDPAYGKFVAKCTVDLTSNVFGYAHTPGAAATCQAAQTCTECGEELDAVKEHEFLIYVSNDDATCQADGTKTAECIYGCGLKDTIVDECTMTDHVDANGNGTCDYCAGEFCELCGKLHTDLLSRVICLLIEFIRLTVSFFEAVA